MSANGEDVGLELNQLRNQKLTLAGGSIAWWPCHIGDSCKIGNAGKIGSLAHIGASVIIGDNCKIQGGAYIANKTRIGDDVFILSLIHI